MEFCQIQLNWLDWTLQNAREKVALLNERGIPVWVMEPVRGGRLCALDAKDEAALRALRPDEGIPAWGFRFLQDVPGVTVILSGMSNLAQMKDNLATFAERKPLSDAEKAALMTIAEGMKNAVPCTGCRYCADHCPMGAGYSAPDGRLHRAALHADYRRRHASGSPSGRKTALRLPCLRRVRSNVPPEDRHPRRHEGADRNPSDHPQMDGRLPPARSRREGL